MREVEPAVWGDYRIERQSLQIKIAQDLKKAMETLVGNATHSDIILVTADGQKLAAHMAIVRQRAPGFYKKYVIPVMRQRQQSPASSRPGSRSGSKTPPPSKKSGQKLTINVGDVPYDSLKFFMSSIYTEDEVPNTPRDPNEKEDEPPNEDSDRVVKFAPDVKSPRAKNVRPAVAVRPLGGNDGGISSSSSRHTFTMGESTHDIFEPEVHTNGNYDETTHAPMEAEEEAFRDRSEPVQVPLAAAAATKFGMRTSFQELYESQSDAGYDDRSIVSERPVLMTSFRELAFESPLRELNPPDGTPERRRHSELVEGEPPFTPDSVTQFPLSPESLEEARNDYVQYQGEISPIEVDREQCSPYAPPQELQATPPRASFAEESRKQSRDEIMMPKFIRFDEIAPYQEPEPEPEPEPADQNEPAIIEKKMFPIFIEFGSPKPVVRPVALQSPQMTTSDPTGAANGFLPSLPFRRRLSVTSLRSLESIDISPSQEGFPIRDSFPPQDQDACCLLADDLLTIFIEQIDTDLIVETKDGDIRAHRYSHELVYFTLSFLYGGLTTVPDSVNAWSLLELADMLQLENLRQIALLHIKAKLCHLFHRPCAVCVSSIFDNLSRFEANGYQDLLMKSLNWQAKYFSRVWKSRAFAQLSEEWQQKCYWAIIDRLCPDNVIQILIGCEKLQVTLPRTMKGGLSTEHIGSMVACLLDAAIEFLASNFDHVVPAESFLNQGRGMALNLGLLEDVLPSVIHALTPDTGCRVLVRLYELLIFLTQMQEQQRAEISGIQVETQWNDRFTNLVRRLYELCDTHLIHCAGSVIKCESWRLLNPSMQQRIRETGIFVEMRQPRAPPPRLSSLNRMYKRSSSAGVSSSSSSFPERRRSLTRRSMVVTGEMQRINENDQTPDKTPEPQRPVPPLPLPVEQTTPKLEPERPSELPKPKTDSPKPVRKQSKGPSPAPIHAPDSKLPQKTKPTPKKPASPKPSQSPKAVTPPKTASPRKTPEVAEVVSPSETVILSSDNELLKKENVPAKVSTPKKEKPEEAQIKSPINSPPKTRRLTQVVKPTVTKEPATKAPSPTPATRTSSPPKLAPQAVASPARSPAPSAEKKTKSPRSAPSTTKTSPRDQNTRPSSAQMSKTAPKRPTSDQTKQTTVKQSKETKDVKVPRKSVEVKKAAPKATTKVQKVVPVQKQN